MRSFFWGFIFLFSFVELPAQILINEVCPSNVSVIQNSNGKYDDWIELYNKNSSTIDLQGYGLSDDNTKPYRFTFPSYSLGAGQRVLVFAADTTNTIIVNHYEMAVNALSSWKYKTGSNSLDTNWRNNSFNDASWSSGNGGIGNGDGDDNKTIPASISVMMRKSFTVFDTSQILKVMFFMDYDDGFVAYLNGVEIARANLSSTGRPAWNTLASSSHEAQMYQGLRADSFFIDPAFLKTVLRQGNNVLAIETHDNSTISTDMSSIPYLIFGMKNSGTTYSAVPTWFRSPSQEYFSAHFKLTKSGKTLFVTNPSGTLEDQLTYTQIETDNSYGRKPDGTNTWCFMSSPSPGTSNNSATCYSGYAGIPVFSKVSDFYLTTQTITLSTITPGGSIRYTTNGNTPKPTDRLYTGPITVSSTTTIRARVFASGLLPGIVVANTYFINVDTHLPIFSITTDSLNLWDYNTGIYVMGPNASSTTPYFGANFWQNWQKPATIEYFDKGKVEIAKFDADISIYGNYSRAKPQKSFEISMSSHYGTSDLNYQFFPDKPYVDKVNDFVLRNSGTDWNVVHFRDALMERMMRTTNCDYLATQPAIMFLNGAYWGVYTIHENHDSHWLEENYNYTKKDFSFLKESGSTISVSAGSASTFWDMYNYATSQSATTQAYYDYMNSVLDLKNYTDYFAAEIYINNGDWIGDWTNNIKMWKPNTAGAKWKYFLYDTDFGFGYSGSVNDDRLSKARNPTAFSYSSDIFDAILKNPTYKRYFINRYADLINTLYLPSNVAQEIHYFQDSMAYDMPEHFAKWGSNTSTWQSNINVMTNFSNARPTIVRDQIKSQFSLTAKVTLTLNVSPAGAGRIEISTITPTSYPWSGIYFNGNPVTITAIPNPGYTFDHFKSTLMMPTNNTNQSVTYNYTGNDNITAYFTGSSANPSITVSEINYNSDSLSDAGDWIELHNKSSQAVNISGWKIRDGHENHTFVFPTGTVLSGNGYLVVMNDSIKFKNQFPAITNKIGNLGFNYSNGGDEIRIFDYNNNLYLSILYQDISPWPIGADGGGYTCELLNQNNSLNDGTNWFAGCLGGSPGRAFSASLSSAVTISGNSTFCSGSNTTLSATSVPGYVYQWRRNNGNIVGATSSNYVATQAGSFTVQISNAGCSVITTAFNVTLVTQSADPVTTSASVCASGSMTLTASASDSIFWYDSPGGNLLGQGTSFITPDLSTTTTYYAQSSRSCPSNYIAANAVVNAQSVVPLTNDVFRCGPGTVTLTAADTAVIHWYNSASGGALLFTGTSFLTNAIPNDTIFYVEAGNYCPSQRVEVHVTINTTDSPVATDTSRCGPGTLTFVASATSPMYWYSSPSGGASIGSGSTFTTPTLASTDTFYVEANGGCASNRVRVIGLIHQIPAAPTATAITICGSGSGTFNAISPEQVYWFDAALGGSLLFTGSNYTTPNLSSTTNYYIEAGYICRSSRTMVSANVNPTSLQPTTTDVNRCGTGSVALVANSPDLINWFDSSVGGTLLHTGDTYITPVVSSTTTYFVQAGTSCPSSRVASRAVIDPIPSPPTGLDVSRCGPGSITLTASSTENIYWYDAPTGGALVGTGNSFSTPSLSSSTTYYAETGNTCLSSRISIQAIIAPPPAAPIGTDGNRCGTGVVTLSASSPEVVNWYSVPTGGVSLGSGISFSTPSISSTTTYYAEAGSGCNSSRTPVLATINSVPVAPTTTNSSRCGTGSLTLHALGTETLYWYDSPFNGTLLTSGSTYTTGSITSTTTYYVEQGNSCRSGRSPVDAVINTYPNPPTATDVSRCGNGTVTLTATSVGTINWYDQLTGGSLIGTGNSFTTPSITGTTKYYAESNNGCISLSRTTVQAIVDAIPAAPLTAASSRCGSGSVTLNATSPEQIYWFSSAVGGASIGTGVSFITPSITTTTTYYVETGNTCRSQRISVLAIVNDPPTSPTIHSASRCGTGAVTLTASSIYQINWYSVATGGAPINTGPSFTTPSISSTTIYYVDAGTGCNSPRVAVNATVNSIPAAPIVTDGSRCNAGTISLSAVSPDQIYWYDASSGGTLLFTGAAFTTPSISTTTIYYSETGNTCRSPRVSVNAIINLPAAIPTTTNASRCGNGSVVLNASSGVTINWYDLVSGGVLLNTGATFTTPNLSSTTTYYVESFNGTCTSNRVPIDAIINSIPAAPTVSDFSRCDDGTLTLSVVSALTVNWFDSPSGGLLLATGNTFLTPFITTTTPYYVSVGTTCISPRAQIYAIISSPPSDPVVTDNSNCGNGSVTLTATAGAPINWYDGAGVLLFTGNIFTTPVLSATTVYYADAGVGCNSNRVPVNAIINPVPSAPTVVDVTRCDAGIVTLNVVTPEIVSWFNSPSGGVLLATGNSFTTPSLITTTPYYVAIGTSCISPRAQIYAIVLDRPADPVVTNNYNCGPGTVTLIGTAGAPINWYDGTGVFLATGNSFVTSVLSATTNYFADAGTGCNSNQVPVVATINAIPSDPTSSDVMICGSGSASLSATSTEQVYWYDDLIGGNLLSTGSTYTTSLLSASQTYFVEAGDICRSNRIPVTVNIEPVSIISSTQNASNCGPGIIQVGAVSSDVINWYDAPGGNLLFTGTTFATSISATTTFYAVAGTLCPSNPIGVAATIFNQPSINIGPDSLFAQSGQLINLDAGSGFTSYDWSSTETTQQISVTISGLYSVVATDLNGCQANDQIYVDFSTLINSVELSNSVSLYPNPTHNHFVIEMKNNHYKKIMIKLIAVDGKLLQSRMLQNSGVGAKEEVNMNGYSAGVYFVQLTSEQETTLLRIVLQ